MQVGSGTKREILVVESGFALLKMIADKSITILFPGKVEREEGETAGGEGPRPASV